MGCRAATGDSLIAGSNDSRPSILWREEPREESDLGAGAEELGAAAAEVAWRKASSQVLAWACSAVARASTARPLPACRRNRASKGWRFSSRSQALSSSKTSDRLISSTIAIDLR